MKNENFDSSASQEQFKDNVEGKNVRKKIINKKATDGGKWSEKRSQKKEINISTQENIEEWKGEFEENVDGKTTPLFNKHKIKKVGIKNHNGTGGVENNIPKEKKANRSEEGQIEQSSLHVEKFNHQTERKKFENIDKEVKGLDLTNDLEKIKVMLNSLEEIKKTVEKGKEKENSIVDSALSSNLINDIETLIKTLEIALNRNELVKKEGEDNIPKEKKANRSEEGQIEQPFFYVEKMTNIEKEINSMENNEDENVVKFENIISELEHDKELTKKEAIRIEDQAEAENYLKISREISNLIDEINGKIRKASSNSNKSESSTESTATNRGEQSMIIDESLRDSVAEQESEPVTNKEVIARLRAMDEVIKAVKENFIKISDETKPVSGESSLVSADKHFREKLAVSGASSVELAREFVGKSITEMTPEELHAQERKRAELVALCHQNTLVALNAARIAFKYAKIEKLKVETEILEKKKSGFIGRIKNMFSGRKIEKAHTDSSDENSQEREAEPTTSEQPSVKNFEDTANKDIVNSIKGMNGLNDIEEVFKNIVDKDGFIVFQDNDNKEEFKKKVLLNFENNKKVNKIRQYCIKNIGMLREKTQGENKEEAATLIIFFQKIVEIIEEQEEKNREKNKKGGFLNRFKDRFLGGGKEELQSPEENKEAQAESENDQERSEADSKRVRRDIENDISSGKLMERFNDKVESINNIKTIDEFSAKFESEIKKEIQQRSGYKKLLKENKGLQWLNTTLQADKETIAIYDRGGSKIYEDFDKLLEQEKDDLNQNIGNRTQFEIYLSAIFDKIEELNKKKNISMASDNAESSAKAIESVEERGGKSDIREDFKAAIEGAENLAEVIELKNKEVMSEHLKGLDKKILQELLKETIIPRTSSDAGGDQGFRKIDIEEIIKITNIPMQDEQRRAMELLTFGSLKEIVDEIVKYENSANIESRAAKSLSEEYSKAINSKIEKLLRVDDFNKVLEVLTSSQKEFQKIDFKEDETFSSLVDIMKNSLTIVESSTSLINKVRASSKNLKSEKGREIADKLNLETEKAGNASQERLDEMVLSLENIMKSYSANDSRGLYIDVFLSKLKKFRKEKNI